MKKALVLSLALVLCLGVASFGQTLSGLWNTTITITPTPLAISSFVSNLKVTYAVSGWSFTSDSLISTTGWRLQSFNASGALGAFTFGSSLIFDPQLVSMVQWVVNGGVSLAGLAFDGTFVSVPGDTAFILGASGSAGNVDIEVDVKLGSAWFDEDGMGYYYASAFNYLQAWYADEENLDGCGFDFSEVVIGISFPFCCAEVDAEIMFTCLGFEYAEFGVTDIAIPNLPWLSLDATVHFEMGEKSMIVTPNFDFGAIACFNLYIGQYGNYDNDPYSDTYGQWIFPNDDDNPLLLQDFAINGIGLKCTIGGVEFQGISFWGDVEDNYQKPGLLYGLAYWEAYRIKTTDDGCCGPFSFDVTVYFLEDGTKLFDLAEIRANMSIQVATQFTFSMGIRYSTETSTFTRWSLGFKVVW